MQDSDDNPSESEEEFSTTSVVAHSFCAPNPTEFAVKKKYHRFFTHQRYEALDPNGNLLLQVDGSSLNLHKKRVMRDSSGRVILTMRQKVKLLTLRHWWTVHRGKSSDPEDLAFEVERSHPLEMEARLDVFVGHRSVGDRSDAEFRLVSTTSDLRCRVYRGHTVVAEVTDGFPTRSFFKNKESFRVKINGGVDYALVFALFVIFTVNDYI